MPIIEGLGWIAATFLPFHMLPIQEPINDYNTNFAAAVDSGDSCWDRVDGTVNHYGSPSDYSLDLLCNYRLEHYTEEGTVKKWRLTR